MEDERRRQVISYVRGVLEPIIGDNDVLLELTSYIVEEIGDEVAQFLEQEDRAAMERDLRAKPEGRSL